MGRVRPSRWTRTWTFGPIRSNAAASARKNGLAAKKSRKLSNKLRRRKTKSIKAHFSLKNQDSREIRPGKKETNEQARSTKTRGSPMLLRGHKCSQLKGDSKVQWGCKTKRRRLALNANLRRRFRRGLLCKTQARAPTTAGSAAGTIFSSPLAFC